jgi:hypothetical protein
MCAELVGYHPELFRPCIVEPFGELWITGSAPQSRSTDTNPASRFCRGTPGKQLDKEAVIERTTPGFGVVGFHVVAYVTHTE